MPHPSSFNIVSRRAGHFDDFSISIINLSSFEFSLLLVSGSAAISFDCPFIILLPPLLKHSLLSPI